MRVLDKIKSIIRTASFLLALGVVSSTANAATIVNEPTITYKYSPVSVGATRSCTGSNIKINGKSISKSKKSVKAICTYYDPSAIRNPGTKTAYLNYELKNEFVPDTEDFEQKNDNDKWIAESGYEFKFLKAGTYKISYDTYGDLESKTVENPDGLTKTTTYTLKKTHHVEVYKVLSTTRPVKKITLGKNKITWTDKNTAGKSSTKTVTNYRFLQGSKGKLTISTNKNYSVTSAYVVTYAANGDAIYTAAGNKKNVTYGKYKNVWKNEEVRSVIGADGKEAYTEDPVTKEKTYLKERYVVSEGSSKYKPTEIHYGLKDSFTGNYTKYSLSTRTVYQKKCDEYGKTVYQKNADGTYVKDEDGDRVPVIDTVTATVITSTYPIRDKVNGVYSNITVVSEKVILPASVTKINGSNYYLDAACKGESFYPGTETVSKNGIQRYIYVTYEGNKTATRVVNPVYKRTFYNVSNQGSWQVVPEGNYDYEYAIYDIDATGKQTTKYGWYETKDAEGNTIPVVDKSGVSLGGLDDYQIFNKK